MLDLNKSYYCGKGDDFFGEKYSTKLEIVYNNIKNYDECDYQIVYSLDIVNNVNIVKPASFKTQQYFKNDILLKKENLAQVWFETNQYLDLFNDVSMYCYNKLTNIYPSFNRKFGNPMFSLTIYDKDCFIKEHKDGDDDDKSRLCVVLLYLNKDWKKGMGGELIITDETNNKIEITPEFGNFAILDFQNYNLIHEVKPITDDNFHRKALISFIHLAK
jgi:hypothetical protein